MRNQVSKVLGIIFLKQLRQNFYFI